MVLPFWSKGAFVESVVVAIVEVVVLLLVVVLCKTFCTHVQIFRKTTFSKGLK